MKRISIQLAFFIATLFELIALCQQMSAQTVTAALSEEGFRTEIERLDGICAKLKLSAERELMAAWLPSDKTDAHLLFLPIAVDPLAVPDASPTAGSHGNWLKHFSAARTRHAQYWFEQSKKQSAAGDEWVAYRALWRAAREDGDHPETKRVLGTLLTALSVKGKPRPVPTVHPKFGWPAGSYSRMETANFKITSRTDATTTQKIAAELEQFYALWTQAFYPLWAAPGVTAGRLAGRTTNWQRRQQVDVVLCKDRDDYLKTLGVAESNIGVSVGYYSPEAQMSFFYPDENLNATLFHELTHQLLAEASQLRGASTAGDKSRFWLIEAVALYMESLTPTEHHWRLGGWLAPRMQAARYRAVHDGYWIEPEKLDAIGLADWKEREDIAQLYTHAAGLAHFFMDRRLPKADDETSATDPSVASDSASQAAKAAEERLDKFDAEASRAAFFAALIAAYRGDKPPEKLWQVAGLEHAQQDYLHFQLVRDRHIESLIRSPVNPTAVDELVLARCRLSKANWQALGQFTGLRWLELSGSNATPDDLRWIKQMKKLERLGCEGLVVDRALIESISEVSELKELDLALTNVDDEMLLPLKKCAKLKTLWLNGTKATKSKD